MSFPNVGTQGYLSTLSPWVSSVVLQVSRARLAGNATRRSAGKGRRQGIFLVFAHGHLTPLRASLVGMHVSAARLNRDLV